MSWRDDMKRAATFRLVPFHIDSAEASGGRRTVKHEFALRDEPFSEDMGRKARGFPLEGFVIGDDYLDKKRKLVEALELAGPGELVHPYWGTLRVICSSFKVHESSEDGGLARFSIEFDQTESTPAFPATAVDTAAVLASSASGALDAARTEFLALFQIGSLAGGAVAKLALQVKHATIQLGSLLGPLAAGAQELASLQQGLGNLASTAGALMRAPATLFDSLAGTVGALGAAGDPAKAVQALLAAYNFNTGTPRPPATTPRRVLERQAHDATEQMIRRISLVQAALVSIEGVTPGAPGAYVSYEDAIATRDTLTLKIDEQLELAGDTFFPSLMQLRADLVSAVPGAESDLARLVSHTPAVSLPSLLLSHQLYRHLDGEADLLARNHVQHPGFVPGGHAVEVLSRA